MAKKRRALGRSLEEILNNPTKSSSTEKYFNTYFPEEEYPGGYIGEPLGDTYEDGLDEEPYGDTEEPKVETEPEPIPPPSEIYTVDQAADVGGAGRFRRSTPRPDLYEGYYGQGPSRSTRVQAYQWIPTHMSSKLTSPEQEDELYGQAALLKGYDTGERSLFGDLLIAFARPSKTQETRPQGSLYVYRDNPESVWDMFKKSNSLGKAVNLLSSGTLYVDSDGERYKDIHKDTIDPETDEAWAMWIFDDYWGLRANNESPLYRAVGGGRKNFG